MKIEQIPITQIDTSPLNPRRNFHPEALQDLGNAMKSQGQLQVATVRLVNGRYMLVDGARRLAAAKLVGIEHLDCHVVRMSDPQSLIYMLASGRHGNVVPLSPIEEAEGMRTAIEAQKVSLSELARSMGISPSTVSKRMSLLKLPKDLQKLVEDEVLPVRTAELLALLPESMQEQAREISASHLYGGAPMPYEAARSYFGKIAPSLKAAIWRLDEPLGDKPPCHGCLRNSANTEGVLDGRTAQLCLDAECYRFKTAFVRAAEASSEAGEPVEALTEEQNAEVFPPGEKGISWESNYVELGKKPEVFVKPEVERVDTWEKLTEGQGLKKFVAVNQEGQKIIVAKIDDAITASVAAGNDIFCKNSPGAKPEPKPRKEVDVTDRKKIESEFDSAERKARLVIAKRDSASAAWLKELLSEGKIEHVSAFSLASLQAEFLMSAISEPEAAFILPCLPDSVCLQGESAMATLKAYYAAATPGQVLTCAIALLLVSRLRSGGVDQAWVSEWHRAIIRGEEKEAQVTSGDDKDEEFAVLLEQVEKLLLERFPSTETQERIIKFATGKQDLDDITEIEDLEKLRDMILRPTPAPEEPKQAVDLTESFPLDSGLHHEPPAPKPVRAKLTNELKLEVKRLVCDGKTAAEIAHTLCISLPSIQNIKKELGLVKARISA